MRHLAAAALPLLALLAGCFGPDGDSGAPAFDGGAARSFVAGLVTDGSGAPRYRVPGTPAHTDARMWLANAMVLDGWTVQRQPFTGEDYEALDKGSAEQYVEHDFYCSDEEAERAEALAMENFYAVRDVPGSDRLVLLGAHWDSKRHASNDPDPARRSEPVLGANDGASGVGLLLQLMRHVAQHGVALPFDLGVAFFDAEDGFEDCHPLAGSIYFVSRLAPGEVDRMLLLDMVGDADARFVREGNSVGCDPALVGLLHDLAPAQGLAANFPGTQRSVTDDHMPFIEAGIPAVDLIDFGRSSQGTGHGFPPYWHTTHDTMGNISADMLGRVGDLVLAVLQDERFVADWPATCA